MPVWLYSRIVVGPFGVGAPTIAESLLERVDKESLKFSPNGCEKSGKRILEYYFKDSKYR
jgi:hypothetical protein